MKIFVKVKPKSKKEKIEKLGNTNFRVYVKELPEKGEANAAVLKALAGYFGVSRQNVQIISGSTSRLKVIEINK